METTERWLPVVGYEGFYEVSDHGRVRSLDRVTPTLSRGHLTVYDRVILGRPLKIILDDSGRRPNPFVALCRDGIKEKGRIGVMVLEAFVGPRPAGMWCLHWDDDPVNNRLENLRWGTPKNNSEDALRNGVNGQAKKTHCKYGHEYTPENTQYLVGPTNGTDGRSRRCATCHREAEARRKWEARGDH